MHIVEFMSPSEENWMERVLVFCRGSIGAQTQGLRLRGKLLYQLTPLISPWF